MERPGLMLMLALILGCGAMGCSALSGALGARVIRGSGNVAAEEHEVRDFTSVTFATIGQLLIEQGEEEGLRIEAEDNLLPYFESEIHNGELIIREAGNVTLQPTQPVRFHLRVRTLEGLAVTGSGSASAARLAAETFSAQLTGSGDLTLGQLAAVNVRAQLSGSGAMEIAALTATQLDAQLTGAGAMQFAGEVRSQQLTLSGSGDYRAAALHSHTADVVLTGSGAVQLHVAEKLSARLTGSGSILYTGAPMVESQITGSGWIKPRES